MDKQDKKINNEKKSKVGRPTKYKPEYCEEIIKYFDIDHTREVQRTRVSKSGEITTWTEEVANDLPTFERFSFDIGVNRSTLLEWKGAHAEFSAAYTRAKEAQKHMLMTNSLNGLYNPQYAVFTSKNITDMRDKTETDLTTNGESINNAFSKLTSEQLMTMHEEVINAGLPPVEDVD